MRHLGIQFRRCDSAVASATTGRGSTWLDPDLPLAPSSFPSPLAFVASGFPSCALHHNLTFGTLGASWYDWVWHASYDPHGPVHVAIGGTFNCRAQYDSLNETVIPKDLERLRVFSYVTLKSGWRAHLVEMPKYCSMDTPQEECTPHCPDLDIVEKYKNISKLEEMWAVLLQGTKMYRGYTHEQKVKVLKTICQTPITPGDQLEASSPLDVSFWPIHPTMERLWAYKKLAHAFTDQTWGTTDGPSRYCTNNGCMGHHEDDVIPFDVVTEDDEGEYASRQLSNIELYKSLNPHSTRMPYVYDHFQWQHCDDSGYRFSQDFAAVDS